MQEDYWGRENFSVQQVLPLRWGTSGVPANFSDRGESSSSPTRTKLKYSPKIVLIYLLSPYKVFTLVVINSRVAD